MLCDIIIMCYIKLYCYYVLFILSNYSMYVYMDFIQLQYMHSTIQLIYYVSLTYNELYLQLPIVLTL